MYDTGIVISAGLLIYSPVLILVAIVLVAIIAGI